MSENSTPASGPDDVPAAVSPEPGMRVHGRVQLQVTVVATSPSEATRAVPGAVRAAMAGVAAAEAVLPAGGLSVGEPRLVPHDADQPTRYEVPVTVHGCLDLNGDRWVGADPPTGGTVPSTNACPLVCVRAPALRDDLLRLAAAVSADVDVRSDPAAARSQWIDAPLVVVGLDVAGEYVAARLPHRPDLVLVADERVTGPDDEAVWRRAAELGADHVVFLPTAEAWLVARYTEAVAGPAALRGEQPQRTVWGRD